MTNNQFHVAALQIYKLLTAPRSVTAKKIQMTRGQSRISFARVRAPPEKEREREREREKERK